MIAKFISGNRVNQERYFMYPIVIFFQQEKSAKEENSMIICENKTRKEGKRKVTIIIYWPIILLFINIQDC